MYNSFEMNLEWTPANMQIVVPILCALVIPVACISAKKTKNLVNYPQIRAKTWTRSIYYMNLIGWAFYSATHIPKGLDETIGAIPLGAVLCLLTYASGTIWIAVIVHIAMAWANCLTALKPSPRNSLQTK